MKMNLAQALELAHAHFNAGRMAETEIVCRAILEAWPDQHPACVLWGLAALRRNDTAAAAPLFERAIALNPLDEAAYVYLAMLQQSQGRLAEAEATYRRAIAVNPNAASAQNNLASLLHAQGRLAEAEATSRDALAIRTDADSWNNLAASLGQSGRLEEAEAACRKALEINPDHPGALDNLSVALASQQRYAEAEEVCRRLLTIRPDYARGWNALGVIVGQQRLVEDAERACREAIRLLPSFPEAWNNLGMALRDQGRVDEAADAFFHAVELHPQFHTAHSNALCCIQYQAHITPERILEEHLKWDRQHATGCQAVWPAWRNDLNPERRLRVGFVSPDLGCHPVGQFIVRLLESMDPNACHTICYSSRRTLDPLSQRIRAAVGQWQNVVTLSDEALAEQVRADQVDILVDLAGHTAGDRMLTFARKPAPIQITWLGYTGTTGLAAMDYLLADPQQVPPGAETYYRERVLRLPDDYVVFDPLQEMPAVAPLPATRCGHFTLGSFNNPSKVNREVVRLWARILARLPDARLLVKFRGVDGRAVQARYAGMFSDCGIDPRRVEMSGWEDRDEFLKYYHRVDLALDTFPYGGGLTTCEALWMGVPVVTCPGRTFASRHACTHLTTAGLREFIARDFDEYVELAVRAAGDLPRLAALRAGLRAQVAASPLCDGARQARSFVALLHELWRDWVARQRGARL